MKTRKAKAPDPGAYGEDDITPEDRKRAKDAKAQAADGHNPPSRVSDEETWTRAKEAASKTYDEGDDAYWPAVVHIYGNLGGEIQAKSSKAMQPKGKMKMVAGMMADMDMDAGMMADAADMEIDRVEELMRGDDEPTDAEVSAMMSAMKRNTEKAFDAILKYGTSEGASAGHLTQGHNAEGGGGSSRSPDARAGLDRSEIVAVNSPERQLRIKAADHYAKADRLLARAGFKREDLGRTTVSLDNRYKMAQEKSGGDKKETARIYGYLRQSYEADAKGDNARGKADKISGGYEKAEKADHAHADMADVVGMMSEYGMSESDMAEASGLDADRVKALLHDGAKPTADELAAMTDACAECEKAAKAAKTEKASRAVASESLLKAGLGMSDGEFRRKLGQAVYARWGKQASIDETFPDTQVAIVRAWDGDVWASAYRLLSVPYEAEDGAVTLGEVAGEVRQTYEPVTKSESEGEPDDAPCEVEYVADRNRNGEYVIDGLNGEAHTLAKSLSDAGVQARVEDGADGAHSVVFASRGAVCKQLAVRATVDGEFESEPKSFVPYLRNDVLVQKAEEKGIVYAVVYEPDVVDKQGEWATAEDIEEAAHDYLKRSRRMKRQHDEHSDSEVVESYIAQADFFLGNRMVRKGSWVIAEKLGEKSKKLYKEGKLTGVSMGGHASYAA